MVKKHLAHNANSKDFVSFIGSDLGHPMLLEYLKYTDCHKNTMYLSANSVTEFIKLVIGCIWKPCHYSETATTLLYFLVKHQI